MKAINLRKKEIKYKTNCKKKTYEHMQQNIQISLHMLEFFWGGLETWGGDRGVGNEGYCWALVSEPEEIKFGFLSKPAPY